jgi:ABC-type amino acid transport substrate-binding protein
MEGRRRRVSPLGWAALAALALAGSPLRAADLPEIKTRGALRVLVVSQEDTPEFLSLKKGGNPGFDREILEAFARTQGVRLDFVVVPSWDVLVPWLVEGRGDLIAGRVSSTESRRQRIDFTNEVFPTRVVVINRKPAPPVSTKELLAAVAKIGAIKGTSMEETLHAAGIPTTKIDNNISAGTMQEVLSSGRVGAVAWPLEDAMLAQKKDAAIQIGVFLGPPESLAYGLQKGSAQLKSALNEHIRLVKQSGTWSRLTVTYFGSSAPQILKRAREAVAASTP